MSNKLDPVIVVDHVSKDFVLPHEKVGSVKSVFTGLLRKHTGKSTKQRALRDINLKVYPGEFFGIVGRNGSGKSTLLKILAGIYQPTKGQVRTYGKLVPFIELGVGFNPELTGRENVYLNGAMLGFSEKEVDKMYQSIVEFAELEKFMDQKLKNYSSGMQVRLAFSMAIRAKADILLVDEVLAVGDVAFQRKCFDFFKKLKKDKKTVIFVSHDMTAVREFCSRALLIDNSQLLDIGNTEKVAREYNEIILGSRKDDRLPESENDQEKRWGNKQAEMTRVSARLDRDSLVVSVNVRINKPVHKIIFGLHIIGPDGNEVLAMNNTMINEPGIVMAKSGEVYNIEWSLLNIFNDGLFTVNATLVDSHFNALDWWPEASKFAVKRLERSTTAIFPPINVNVVKERGI